MRIRFLLKWIGLVWVGMLVGGCGGASSLEAVPGGTQTVEISLTPVSPERTLTQEATVPSHESQGEHPLVKQAKEDLAKRLDVPIEEIEVTRYEGVTWPDASLGCPQPGMMYAQVLTPGYLIVLQAGGKEYEYHADSNEQVILCEAPQTPTFPVKPGDIQDGEPWER